MVRFTKGLLTKRPIAARLMRTAEARGFPREVVSSPFLANHLLPRSGAPMSRPVPVCSVTANLAFATDLRLCWHQVIGLMIGAADPGLAAPYPWSVLPPPARFGAALGICLPYEAARTKTTRHTPDPPARRHADAPPDLDRHCVHDSSRLHRLAPRRVRPHRTRLRGA